MIPESDTRTFRVQAATILEVAQKVALPILLGVAGWTFTNMRDHELRLTRIESTRYTQKDAEADRAAAAKERAALAAQLAVSSNASASIERRLGAVETSMVKVMDKLDSVLIELRRGK